LIRLFVHLSIRSFIIAGCMLSRVPHAPSVLLPYIC